MKYIALNLFLGSHPSQTAMLVSCGRPCIYIKIVWKILPLFTPWVRKHDLLGARCAEGWACASPAPRSVPRWFAGGRTASRGQQSRSGPLSRWGPLCLWFLDTCHCQNDIFWNGILVWSAAGVVVLVCLIHTRSVSATCAEGVQHALVTACLFCTDLLLVLKRKTLAASFWESTEKKKKITQGIPNNRG